MRWKRYPAYKDSGVEWLGEVPEHWDVASVKWVYEIRLGKMLQNRPTSPNDRAVPYLKAVHVDWGDVRVDELPTMWAADDDIRYYGVKEGDLLVCEGGQPGRAGIVNSVPDKCIMQNSLHRVRAESTHDLGFLLYVLWEANKCGYLDSECNKATIVHFTREKFGNLRIPWPSIDQRGYIAFFLDKGTTHIDTLISKKQRQLELLEERRTALITNAVSKGLDPNVKMKDSGVEWLGKVPEHWVVTCLGRFARVKSGEFISNEETSGEKQPPHVYPVIGGNGIMGYCADYNEECPLIVIGRVGALCGNVHLLDERVWVTDNALILHDMRGFRLDYLTYFLQMAQLNQYASQTAQPLITGSMLKAHSVVLPPFEEQRSIVSFLECQTACIDALRDKIQQSIELLQEYRSALISAAVTGQIDVREEVV